MKQIRNKAYINILYNAHSDNIINKKNKEYLHLLEHFNDLLSNIHDDNSNNTLYIFKSGIFFILLDNDAKIASQILNLKLTYFTENVLKCGFPISSLEKYTNILEKTQYNFKIIDNIKNVSYSINDYTINEQIEKLLFEISSIDINSLSVKEAYDFIEAIKDSAQYIIRKDQTNANQ